MNGTRVGHFRIESKLGEGGMGVVYRAIDDKLGRTVALKVLPESFARDEERRGRFLREARVAASLTHPNLVTIYEVGEAEGRIYIAMELVEGTTLRRRLDGGPMDIADVTTVAIGVARGLAKAHDRGIHHRDLKPDNIMVNDELETKILDFGLARPVDANAKVGGALGNAPTEMRTEEGLIIGTPGYMSPEQASGQSVDVRTDIFSFGVVLYEMLTGVRPFHGDTPMAIAIASTRDAPAPPRPLNPAMGDQLERIVMRCLEKRPDDRYPNARALLRDLDAREVPSIPPADRPISNTAIGSMPTELGAPPPGLAAGTTDLVLASESRPPIVAKQPSRAPWIAGALVVGAVGLGVLAFARSNPTPVRDVGSRPVAPSTGAAPSAGTAAGVAATAVTDLPLPPSKNQAAVSEYAAGVQALRDDSYGKAREHFGRALELDDSMAAAHLRLAIAMMFTADPTVFQAHFAKAVGLRGQLTERDQALLEALEPMLGRGQDDRIESFERLKKLSARYPGDVELLDLVAAGRSDDVTGLAYAERAIALDPKDAQAWETKGRLLAAAGRVDEARTALERCTQVSLGSSDCFYWLSQLDADVGHCAKAVQSLRQGLDRDPSFVRLLCPMMLSAGEPIMAVRERLLQAEALVPEGARRMTAIVGGTRIALATGDFVEAKKLLNEGAQLLDGDAHATTADQVVFAVSRTDLAIETGDDAEVSPIARSFALRSATWASADRSTRGLNESVRILKRAIGHGGFTPAEFATLRATWIADRQKLSGAPPILIWIYGYAVAVDTADEAKAALAELPKFGAKVWDPNPSNGNPDAEIGHVYLLAGRIDEALPHLEKAAAVCDIGYSPFIHARAALDLGAAREAKGDEKGACAAYKTLLDRWDGAKPRSRSADKARARSRALSCGH